MWLKSYHLDVSYSILIGYNRLPKFVCGAYFTKYLKLDFNGKLKVNGIIFANTITELKCIINADSRAYIFPNEPLT